MVVNFLVVDIEIWDEVFCVLFGLFFMGIVLKVESPLKVERRERRVERAMRAVISGRFTFSGVFTGWAGSCRFIGCSR